MRAPKRRGYGAAPRCPNLKGARGDSHVPFATITMSYASFWIYIITLSFNLYCPISVIYLYKKNNLAFY